MDPVALSDIDLVGLRWHNNMTSLVGALSAFATVVAINRIAFGIFHAATESDMPLGLQMIVYGVSVAAGVTVGHLVICEAIGLIAQSAIAKTAWSLSFSALGALAGLSLSLAIERRPAHHEV